MTSPTPAPSRSLRRDEAEQRAALLRTHAYVVDLDLTRGDETFGSTSTVRFSSGAGETFLDVHARAVTAVRLDGAALDPASVRDGRLPLRLDAGEHELVVEATMAYRTDGEGMHRAVDPADGAPYLYLMCFMDAAPSAFACFDQPDLKATWDVTVTAPAAWTVRGNGVAVREGTEGDADRWRLEGTQPLPTYLVTLVAGGWHVVEDSHDGIALGLSARRSLAVDLDREADELLTLTRQSFDELHRLFGIRYPFGQYHQAFVPEFNAGAMENAGCVLFRDPMVFSSKVNRDQRIGRASTIAHEMAHQWFGNLVTPVWWDDLWLNESFAEYAGTRVTADATVYDDAWTNESYVRRPWGLGADRRPTTHPVAGEPGTAAPDAATALGDFDGISYAKGAAVLRQLARRDDEVFWRGVSDHMRAHAFGNATLADLVGSWERAGAGDLSDFVAGWLRTAGPDTLTLDRAAGVVRCTPYAPGGARREHAVEVALGPDWRRVPLVVTGDEAPLEVPDEAPVVLDAAEDTWALVVPDPVTLAALPPLLGSADRTLRAAVWGQVRNGFGEAAVDPALVLDLVDATTPTETDEDAVARVLPWVLSGVVAHTADPEAAAQRVHEAALARATSAEAGSTLQLSAVQAAVAAAGDVDLLRSWLAGAEPAPGCGLDLDLRWRVLRRLAMLGATDLAELDAEVERERNSHAVTSRTAARASMPTAEAKAWAWQVFTGELEATNYEVEAAGNAFWHSDQGELLAPYADRYLADLPATAERRTGWTLADAARAFFPRTWLSEVTLEGARTLAARDDLASGLRRALLDCSDDLARRIAVQRTFGPGA
ncbi:aminopeptidase N [uncultured Nocardioides sp.]|uniref:aminopeptidase N n=1 Tax=uncultured Nocardioides sp. TaxID=198441 RepID=UPI00260C68A5|nr:aminopeptidase N [uncultured Nocardioides sp.]